jgi:hypothetical protein
MGGVMGDVMKEMRSGLLREEVPDDAVETDCLDEKLPDGTALVVRSVGGLIGGGGESVTVTRSAGGNLVVKAPEGGKLKVSRVRRRSASTSQRAKPFWKSPIMRSL